MATEASVETSPEASFNWGLVGRIIVGTVAAIMIQMTAFIFTLWYADTGDFIFCESSFYGSPPCPEPRPYRDIVIWAVPIAGILLGGIVPALLLRARWWQVLISAIVTPLIALTVMACPFILLIAIISASG